MKNFLKLGTAAVLFGTVCLTLFSADNTREIRFVADDAQVKMASKLYRLKYVKPGDISPYLESAVKRYNGQSTVRRVNYNVPQIPEMMIMVTTGEKFLPYVDALVAAIDRPCSRKDANGSIIESTGIARYAYSPKYRNTKDLAPLLEAILGTSTDSVYVNPQTNILFWKDETHSAMDTLRWLKNFDRPLPQVKLRFNYYEVRESDLRDIGFDYLAWKNGPGVNLLNVGYAAGKLAVDEGASQLFANATEALSSLLSEGATSALSSFSTAWGFGGIFTAPQFDMSFIRMLQQSGKASLSADAELTMINTPIGYVDENGMPQIAKDIKGSSDPLKPDYNELSKYTYKIQMVPEYQNIFKTGEGRMSVGNGSYKVVVDEDADVTDCTYDYEKLRERVSINFEKSAPKLVLTVSKPVICYPSGNGLFAGLKNIPTEEQLHKLSGEKNSGGVTFSYTTSFRNVVERSDVGSELNNSADMSGGMTIGFGNEKPLTIFEQYVTVKQKVGINFLIDIPILGYLFGTETSIKTKSYIIVTVEASLVMPDYKTSELNSRSKDIYIREVRTPDTKTIAEKMHEQKQIAIAKNKAAEEAEKARKAEEVKKAKEAKAAEKARKAEEVKKAKEAKAAEKAKKAEEAKKAKEAKAAEKAKKTEEAKRAKEAKAAEKNGKDK